VRYFLTGATGFIGGCIARQLRASGHEVVALVRNPAKARDLAELGVTLAPGDVTDPASLRAPMQGADGVFHVAGWYKVGVKDTRDAERINVDGTYNVLEAMQELRIPKGVYTSTLAVNSDTHGQLVDETYHYDGPHLSVYDRTKAEAHRIAAEFAARGLPLVIAMPGLVYGPGDTSSTRTTLVLYLQRRLPMAPSGTAFCWGHVDDITGAHILAMDKGRPGEAYMICGPAHTLVEGLQLVREFSGVPMPPVVPPAVFKISSVMASVAERLVTLPEMYSAEYLRVAAGTTYLGNNAKARSELGYAPRLLRDGLKETIEHELRLLRAT
jgi:nucleoside-diphosphate-sugar epimerase